MRKWMRRAYVAHPGVTADDIPGWRRWILRVWRSPRLRQAMRRKGLPLYHTALCMRRGHRGERSRAAMHRYYRKRGMVLVPLHWNIGALDA